MPTVAKLVWWNCGPKLARTRVEIIPHPDLMHKKHIIREKDGWAMDLRDRTAQSYRKSIVICNMDEQVL